MSRSRNTPAKGQGAARAKQMGLLLDLSPEGMMDVGGNEEELETELLSLIGDGRSPNKKGEGKTPVPMADIERMAALCMKDLDDEEGDEDGDLENDVDLLAELSEVLEEEEKAATPTKARVTPQSSPSSHHDLQGLEAQLTERISMYQTAIANAQGAGETSKARRYDRGLKTLQSMLSSVKKGKLINEGEIPPPVSTGGKTSTGPQTEPIKEQQPQTAERAPDLSVNQRPPQEALPKPHLLPPPQKTLAVTPVTPLISPLTPSQPDAQHSEAKRLVLSRQREYKLAAIQAKQSGDTELAKRHYLTAKKLDPLVEALDQGETVDLGALPPSPLDAAVENPAAPLQFFSQPTAGSPSVPPVSDAGLPPPHSMAEALQQRMDRYKVAAEGAKSKGDERKARMHQRIVKQYQDAIKAHKAGRPINLSDLPVPPGCAPLQGTETGEQSLSGVLETAMKLANQDMDAEGEDGLSEGLEKLAVRPVAQRTKAPASAVPGLGTTGAAPATGPGQGLKMGSKVQQQLDFLLTRKRQFQRAALRSKQMKDMQGAALHLRNAKGMDHMISATKGGLPVDITKVPSAPVSEEDYALVRPRGPLLSPRSSEQYAQLMEQLRQQHQKCQSYSQQFTHMGNVAETTRFEKLAEECMKYIEVLKTSHSNGYPVPKFHNEERTFSAVKIFPELTNNDMVLTIVKGVKLSAPSGVSPSDLNTSVSFEFLFPSSEEAQRDKTVSVKNTNCPEFKQKFNLNISRSHRGFKRVIQTKGIKFEIIHKGGLFKTEKVVGNAQLKLDLLETQCEIRQLVEVLDGRRATGGRLEVWVKIREPLGGPQLQTITEKWLVVDPISEPPSREVAVPKPKLQNNPIKNVKSSRSPPQYTLYSCSLLQDDKERMERKILEYKRNKQEPPGDLLELHRDLSHRLQWQREQLVRPSEALLKEYEHALCGISKSLSDSVRKLSSQGNRDAAKKAHWKLKMVENEMESLRRSRRLL